METKQKFDWEQYLKRIKERGYEILWFGHCPNCGGKAVQIHSTGVCHSKCENEDWSNTGFGGPNTRSWEGAVAWGNLTEEQRQEEQRKVKEAQEKRNQEVRDFLLGE